ncbi:MAG: 5'-nucleotidase, lipoprotein e(P4) family [Bacteroidales bacterium]|jgi:5'-nucleotidase (lipoprotein e(P4) family)|nr:5'-nucleotidase, lipoprotein e(P4) family [Bacteroidales bacterium]
MKKLLFLLLGVTILLNSCQQSCVDEKKSQDHLIMSSLWYQKSGEMKAIYHQCFNWAELRIDMILAENTSETKKAVIVDIDETMLDNSPFQTHCINTGESFTKETWSGWTTQIKAKPLPGAVEFSKYAESKGIEVFYISNRSVDDFDVTLKNLQKENFAFADSAHLLLKSDTRSKKPRRDVVRENYEIVLLIGDNLIDFSEIFEDRSANFGFDIVEEHSKDFGFKFIVLPNPMYGEWEREVFENRKDLNNKEKYELRKSNLIGY